MDHTSRCPTDRALAAAELTAHDSIKVSLLLGHLINLHPSRGGRARRIEALVRRLQSLCMSEVPRALKGRTEVCVFRVMRIPETSDVVVEFIDDGIKELHEVNVDPLNRPNPIHLNTEWART
jgi:hypothetical protein